MGLEPTKNLDESLPATIVRLRSREISCSAAVASDFGVRASQGRRDDDLQEPLVLFRGKLENLTRKDQAGVAAHDVPVPPMNSRPVTRDSSNVLSREVSFGDRPQ